MSGVDTIIFIEDDHELLYGFDVNIKVYIDPGEHGSRSEPPVLECINMIEILDDLPYDVYIAVEEYLENNENEVWEALENDQWNYEIDRAAFLMDY